MARNDITGAELKTKAATPEYRNNYDRIFGDKKVTRGRFIQHPVTHELIPAHEYQKEDEAKLMICVDNWDAYESPVSGEVISTRRQRDRDLKANGCRQYEGKQAEMYEANKYRTEKSRELTGKVMETMERTYYEIEHGYRRVE